MKNNLLHFNILPVPTIQSIAAHQPVLNSSCQARME